MSYKSLKLFAFFGIPVVLNVSAKFEQEWIKDEEAAPI